MTAGPLPRSFYERLAPDVAPDLLGCLLVRSVNGRRLVGRILETEAYQGEEDQACHARVGLTARTAVMYGPPGHAYIYFTYGMHWLLNAVTSQPGVPSAVLIRSVEAIEGLDQLEFFRPHLAGTAGWLNGPAKVAQAFNLTGLLNAVDLCDPASPLLIESGARPQASQVLRGPRVGISSVPEPWRSLPWRWSFTPGR